MEYAGFGKKPPSRMPWFLMAITSTASVVILLAVLMVVRTSQSPSSSTVLDTTIPLGNPQPPTLVHFTDAREYQSFDNDADILWKKLRPSSKGFARWTDPSGETQGFGVSMFHQLHCLENIRSALQGFLNPNSTAEMDSAVMADGRSHLAVHMGHCLDYIRQVSKSTTGVSRSAKRDLPPLTA